MRTFHVPLLVGRINLAPQLTQALSIPISKLEFRID
jgi:hypothetical protein